MKKYTNRDYYRHDAAVDGAAQQFDITEATIAHLFRYPHPALQQRSYGAAFYRELVARDLLTDQHNLILEVGCGTGDFAHDLLQELAACSHRLPYLLLDLSPHLQQAQRARMTDLPKVLTPQFIRADGTQLPFPDQSINGLIISNEVIADFDAIELDQQEWQSTDDPLLVMLREHCRIYDEKVLINIGAIRFIQEIGRVLASGGAAVVTEHGFDGNGRLAYCGSLSEQQQSHLEYSINFDHLRIVAVACGLQVEFCQLIDFLPFDRSVRVANLNDAQGLHNTDKDWPVAAIPAHQIAAKYGCTIEQLNELAGLRLPEIGGAGFPDDHTLPFAVSFKVLIARKN